MHTFFIIVCCFHITLKKRATGLTKILTQRCSWNWDLLHYNNNLIRLFNY
jgi:hypothetical protein